MTNLNSDGDKSIMKSASSKELRSSSTYYFGLAAIFFLFAVAVGHSAIIYDFTFDVNSTTQTNNAPFANGLITGGSEWTDTGYSGGGLHVFGDSSADPPDTGLLLTNGTLNLTNNSVSIEFRFNSALSTGLRVALGWVSDGSCEFGIRTGVGGGFNQTEIFDVNPSGLLFDMTTTSTYDSNIWNYLAFTYNGTTLKEWLNGQKIAELSDTVGELCTDIRPTATSNNIFLGSGTSGSSFSFNGTLDNLKIGNVVQSDAYYASNGTVEPHECSGSASAGLIKNPSFEDYQNTNTGGRMNPSLLDIPCNWTSTDSGDLGDVPQPFDQVNWTTQNTVSLIEFHSGNNSLNSTGSLTRTSFFTGNLSNGIYNLTFYLKYATDNTTDTVAYELDVGTQATTIVNGVFDSINDCSSTNFDNVTFNLTNTSCSIILADNGYYRVNLKWSLHEGSLTAPNQTGLQIYADSGNVFFDDFDLNYTAFSTPVSPPPPPTQQLSPTTGAVLNLFPIIIGLAVLLIGLYAAIRAKNTDEFIAGIGIVIVGVVVIIVLSGLLSGI